MWIFLTLITTTILTLSILMVFQRLVLQAIQAIEKTLVEGLADLLAPILSPKPSPTSEQPTLYEDPTWASDWDGSTPGDSTPFESE